MILSADRELIERWQRDGMPSNDSTREHAVKLLGDLLGEVDELHRVIDVGMTCEVDR